MSDPTGQVRQARGQVSQTQPSAFENPHSFQNKIGRVIWRIVYVCLFRFTPSSMGVWRRFLLRLFGANVGSAWFHPSVRVWAPWLLEVGDDVYVDEKVNLYNPSGIRIGNRVVVSQKTFLCSASHDYTVDNYPLTGGEIVICDDVWIAADAFIGPGRVIHRGGMVGARSVVTKDVEAWTVVAGNPAQFIKQRELHSSH